MKAALCFVQSYRDYVHSVCFIFEKNNMIIELCKTKVKNKCGGFFPKNYLPLQHLQCIDYREQRTIS